MDQSKSWWVYIVECADRTFYTGTTNDVSARVAKHNSGTAAKYTKTRTPVSLIYSAPFPDRSSACKREAAIKKLTRKEKELLVISSV